MSRVVRAVGPQGRRGASATTEPFDDRLERKPLKPFADCRIRDEGAELVDGHCQLRIVWCGTTSLGGGIRSWRRIADRSAVWADRDASLVRNQSEQNLRNRCNDGIA